MSGRVERVGAEVVAGRADRRRQAEWVLSMAEHLKPTDRVLIEQVYRDGRSATDVARLFRRNVRSTQYKLHAIVIRIQSDDFQRLLLHEDLLPREVQATARRLILEGRGLRATARLTGLSLHRVRQQHTRIRSLLQAHAQRDTAIPPSPALPLPPSFMFSIPVSSR